MGDFPELGWKDYFFGCFALALYMGVFVFLPVGLAVSYFGTRAVLVTAVSVVLTVALLLLIPFTRRILVRLWEAWDWEDG